MNILVEGRDRFRLLELTTGGASRRVRRSRSRTSTTPPTPSAEERARALFDRLRELTSSDVQVPEPGTPRLSYVLAARVELAADAKLELLAETSENGAAGTRVRASRGRGVAASDSGRRRARRHERPGPPRVSRCAGGTMACGRNASPKLDAERLRADFAFLDELVNGKPVAYLDSAASTQKPRQVLDAMREFYEHSYANVHRGVYRLAERATRVRGGPPQGRRFRQRAVGARGRLHPQRDRGAESRRLRVGSRQSRAGRPRRRHRARAPLELRALAVHRQAHRGRLPAHPDRRSRRAPARGPRRDRRARATSRSSPTTSSPTRSARSIPSRSSRPGRTSRERSWSWTLRRPLRTARSTSRRSAATSWRSRRTRCAARAASARSGADGSCSRRCPPSISAAR